MSTIIYFSFKICRVQERKRYHLLLLLWRTLCVIDVMLFSYTCMLKRKKKIILQPAFATMNTMNLAQKLISTIIYFSFNIFRLREREIYHLLLLWRTLRIDGGHQLVDVEVLGEVLPCQSKEPWLLYRNDLLL